MTDFLSTATSFPTVIFSVLLVLVLLYWMMVLVGAADPGGGSGPIDGLLNGLGDTLDGAFDSLGSPGGGGGASAGFVASIGLGTVPFTIIASLVIIFAWIFLGLGMTMVESMALASGLTLLATIGVSVASLAASMALTAAFARPLGRLYGYTPAQDRSFFIGRTCIVKTGRVDAGFGQAEATDDEGGTVLLAVRSQEDNHLRIGSVAIIYDYDADEEIFFITADPSTLSTEL